MSANQDRPETPVSVEVSNIKHDVDYDDTGDLPTELVLTVYPENINDREEIIELVSDAISNFTGFCHEGFDIDRIINAGPSN